MYTCQKLLFKGAKLLIIRNGTSAQERIEKEEINKELNKAKLIGLRAIEL